MACKNGNVVIVVLGNELRGDDGAGILFGNLLGEQTSLNVVNGGDAPENFTGIIVEKCPDIVLIVDAMNFNGKPGDIKLVSGENLEKDSVSTHGSLRLFVDYLEKMTGAQILVLGFQPFSTGLGEKISPEVSESVRKIVKHFIDSASISQALQILKVKYC